MSEQCINLLVDRLGMERDAAERYVRDYRLGKGDLEARIEFEQHQQERVAPRKQAQAEQDRTDTLPAKEDYLTKLRGSNSGKFGAKDSDEIYINTAWSEVEERLLEANRGIDRGQMHRLLRDQNFNEDFVREMVEPGSSGSPEAKRFAETFRDEQQVVVQRANNQGAAVIPFDDPVAALQWHDPNRMLGVTRKEWVDFVHGLQKSDGALTPDELGRVYDRFTTHGTTDADLHFDFAGLLDDAPRKGSAARKLTNRSFAPIKFRDAEAWLEYNARFGHESPLQASVYSLRWQTRLAALTERMGPDPYRTHAAVKKSVLKNTDDAAGAREDAEEMDWVFNHLVGDLPEPTLPRLQSLVNVILNLNIVSKLGFAPLTAMNDIGVASVHLNYQGVPFLKSYSRMIQETVKGKPKEMQQDLFRYLHSGTDGVFSFGMGRYQIGDSQPGAFTNMVDTFVHATGLVQLTNRMRTAYSKITAMHMADLASSHSWNSLPSRYKEFLGTYGIDGDDWKLIQEKGVVSMDEHIPDMLQGKKTERIPDERYVVPEAVLRGGSPSQRARTLSGKLSRLHHNEARTAIPEAGLRAREFMMQGQYDGTAAGLALRLFWQFRTPTVHMMQTLFPRMRVMGPTAMMHTLPLTGIGYASLTAKDFFRGRSPRDPMDPETFLLSAGQTGFFFGMSDIVARIHSHGNTNFDELVGGTNYTMFKDFAEVFGAILTGDKAGYETYNFLKSIMPFGNVWYGEAAMNYFVHDRFRELFYPGFTQRQSALLESRGQTKFFGYQPQEF